MSPPSPEPEVLTWIGLRRVHTHYGRHSARAELQIPAPQFPTSTGRTPVEPGSTPTPASAPQLPAPGRPPDAAAGQPDDG